jgi:hypothetical protein
MRFAKVLAAVAALWVQPAVAAVINFDEYTHAGIYQNYDSPFTSGGFAFAGQVLGNIDFTIWGLNDPFNRNADPDGATLTNNAAQPVSVYREGGGLFRLNSIDFAWGGTGTFKLFTDSGVIERVVQGSGLAMQTVSFDAPLVYAFSYDFAGRAVQIDNLNVEQFGPQLGVPALPEPSTWAMMLIGFGAVAAMMRRRQIPRQIGTLRTEPNLGGGWSA